LGFEAEDVAQFVAVRSVQVYFVLGDALNDRAIKELLKLLPAIRKKVENNKLFGTWG
jgi:hypothetical protein